MNCFRLLLPLLLLSTIPALGQVPPLMNNQGMLRTAGGGAVTDGSYDLTFSLYATQTAPAPAWTETVKGVAVQEGFYSTVLGGVTPFQARLFRDHAELWLGVKVGAGTELPRARLLTIAYAFDADHALLATAAEGLQCVGCVDKPALGFDLDAAVSSGAKLACFDTVAELRTALDTVYAPLSHKHAGTDVTSPVAEALLAADSQALGGKAPSYYSIAGHKHAGTDVTSAVANATSAANAAALEGKTLAQVVQAAIDGTLASIASAGYLKKTDKLDQAQLPPNGLDEVSNGLLTNQFQDTTASTDVPVAIHDYYPPGVTATVNFPDVGTAEKLTVTVSLSNSNVSGITLMLLDPAGTSYTLYDRGSTGGTLTATWPDPTTPVAGDLTTWIGKNPTGKWTLTVIDSHFDNKTWPVADGQVTAFSVTTKTLSTKKVQVNGDLVVTGTISGAGVYSIVPAGAVMYFNLTKCPAGWAPLAGAAGRYLVGLASSGTLGASVGTPLVDKEDRAVGQHGHTAVQAAHDHTLNESHGQGNYHPNASVVHWPAGNSSNYWGASDTTTSAAPAITVASAGAVAGTNAPYLQLLVCQKQ